ncbi:MAG: phosphatase PAP2 family protein [Microscillaceae bacterium]|jgi:membrane-associated phospholipid phosphatase|nr:phosphatase PAP2 family protein [Microscillaceae bacterium]
MYQIIRTNRWFWAGFGIYLVLGAVILLTHQRGEFELWLNRHHQPIADFFFSYYTWVGDGLFYALVILGLWWWRSWQTALLGGLCFAATGLAAQFLKHFVFPDVLRPKAFFADRVVLHFVEGLEIHTSQSFPSGHTTTAFSVFCLLSLLVRVKQWGLVFLLLAVFAGFSRVYLLQHFWLDTYFGAILGTGLTFMIYYFYPLTDKDK